MNITPFRWVGGKSKIIAKVSELLPKTIKLYIEPFIGGGACLFHIDPPHAVIGDKNKDLMRTWREIRDNPNGILRHLEKFRFKHSEEFYYECRDRFNRNNKNNSESLLIQAALFLYINSQCFRGLCRYNKSGEFNVPFNHVKDGSPRYIPLPDHLHTVSDKLQGVKMYSGDFDKIREINMKEDTFVVLDPPYDPINKTSNFTSYTADGFDSNMQVRVKKLCDYLTRHNVKVMSFNNNTKAIKELYIDYIKIGIDTLRHISSIKSKKAHKLKELAFINYNPKTQEIIQIPED